MYGLNIFRFVMQRFRVQLMEKFAENERIEQMSVAKKRERQMAHRKEVERILVERREAGMILF